MQSLLNKPGWVYLCIQKRVGERLERKVETSVLIMNRLDGRRFMSAAKETKGNLITCIHRNRMHECAKRCGNSCTAIWSAYLYGNIVNYAMIYDVAVAGVPLQRIKCYFTRVCACICECWASPIITLLLYNHRGNKFNFVHWQPVGRMRMWCPIIIFCIT